MKRTFATAIAAVLAVSVALNAQDNPLSANMKASWANIRDLLVKMADKMPDDAYRFKPTPEMEDFGQRMAHEFSFNMRICAMLKGEQKSVNVSERGTPSKAEILAAIKESNAECDSVFDSLTDAQALQMVTGGRGGPRLRQAILAGSILEHSQEMYGYMAVYLRLKGVVPPSSDRNER